MILGFSALVAGHDIPSIIDYDAQDKAAAATLVETKAAMTSLPKAETTVTAPAWTFDPVLYAGVGVNLSVDSSFNNKCGGFNFIAGAKQALPYDFDAAVEVDAVNHLHSYSLKFQRQYSLGAFGQVGYNIGEYRPFVGIGKRWIRTAVNGGFDKVDIGQLGLDVKIPDIENVGGLSTRFKVEIDTAGKLNDQYFITLIKSF